MYKLPGDVAEPSCQTTIIRGDWLENLNLEVPETLDQYMDVMRAFTRDDPDGNGEDDTYGFSGAAGEWRVFAPFLHPFKAQPHHFVVTEDGTVRHGSVLPGMKEALKVLREAFQEKLIDPTVLTANDFDEIFVNGKVGSFYRWIAYFNPSGAVLQSFKENNPDGEYIYIEPIKGSDGFASDEPEDMGGWCYVSITDAAEDPEAVFKVLDNFAEAEFFKFRKWGYEGEQYEIDDNGVFTNLVPAEDAAGLGMDLLADFFNRKDEHNIANVPEVVDLFNKRAITSQPIRDIRIRFKEPTRPAWIEYGAEIEAKRDEIFYGIMAGDYELDEFDKYVEQFYQMGGKEIEEEAQAFYEKQSAEYDEFMDVYNADLKR
jgi:putative aldouronate transport system substrate-binding protein